MRDLRYDFGKVEELLRQGHEVQITKRRKVIGPLVPERAETQREMPDFLARLREFYGDRILPVTGAEIVAEGRTGTTLYHGEKSKRMAETGEGPVYSESSFLISLYCPDSHTAAAADAMRTRVVR